MNEIVQSYLLIFFPVFFVAMWLTVSTVLALLSGWFRLMANYPDRPEEPILRLRGLSGWMGLGVGMNNILRLSVCPSGLRVGMMRVFGPFNRDFFVPWGSLSVSRGGASLFGFGAKLQFGSPIVVGTLRISAQNADRLARAAAGRWPEPGPFPVQVVGDRLRRLLFQWALITSGAALFFIIAPRIMVPDGTEYPPIAIAILFPAVVFGLVTLVRFFRGTD